MLRRLLSFSGPIRYVTHRTHDGEAYFARACGRGWEGLVVKRGDVPYRSGRSRDWLKFKCQNSQEFVIGGYTDPKGSRTGFGALLLGYYDRDGRLAYAGKVGTGFDEAALAKLSRTLSGMVRPRLRSTAALCRGRACIGSSRASSLRWRSASGPERSNSAIRASKACAGTRTRPA